MITGPHVTVVPFCVTALGTPFLMVVASPACSGASDVWPLHTEAGAGTTAIIGGA